MAFLIITNEIPDSGFTRAQLLNMLATAQAGGDFVDDVTIEANGSGALRVKEIPQSKVTALVADLAAKQPLSAALTTLAGNSGVNLTALNATNLASGTVPAARFPATLPAASGANLTALNASALASGTVPDARFPATLPAASGVNLTALNATNLASGTVTNARLTANLAAIGNLTGLAAGDIIQYNGTAFVRVARRAAVADVNQTDMPAAISATYEQAEVAGLRTVLLDTIAALETLKNRFEVTGGNGLIADTP
jgi:hypothetical protein